MSEFVAYIIDEREMSYHLGDDKDPTKIKDRIWLPKSIMTYIRKAPYPMPQDGLRQIHFKVEGWKEKDVPFREI